MTLERGSLLNKRYRIADVLGQGGMAALYRAIDENLGVEVAVKENLFTTEDFARQFRHEAVILAMLRHNNLPRVTDHFVINSQGQYLVMDYIEGEDLRQRMDRLGTLSDEEIIVVGVAICDALIYMHSREPCVLHRDIKPGNVKITPQGQVFLVDFGLAKVMRGGETTESGARAMTPGYSPPEQYGTARTDPRSDIYSLGATLYSALTNNLPEDALARAMDSTGLTPIRKYNSKVPERLTTVIEKSLAVRPDDRYQSAAEFQKALLAARSTSRQKSPIKLTLSPPPPSDHGDEQVARSEGEEDQDGGQQPPGNPDKVKAGGQPRPSPRRHGCMAWWLVLAGLILLGGSALYIYDPGLPSRLYATLLPMIRPISATPGPLAGNTNEPVGFMSKDTPTVTHTLTPSATATPSPSPTKTSTATPTLRPTQTATITPVPTATPLGGGSGQIAFVSDRSGRLEIWLMSIDGSSLRQVTSLQEGACQPEWSPDGTKLVFISPCRGNFESYGGSSLFIINADGSDMKPLPTVPGGDFDPSWSPDGRRIAFTSLRGSEHSQIYIIDLEDNSVQILADPEGKDNAHPEWSPDGSLIVYVGPRKQIWVMDADGNNRRLVSRGVGDYDNGMPGWSPDGKLIVFTQWEHGYFGSPWLATVLSDGSQPAVVVAKGSLLSEAAYSPDGYWLVCHGRPDDVFSHIYIMTPNDVARTQLTKDEANDFDPAWKP